MRILFVIFTIIACCGPFENPQSSDYPCGPKGISCGKHRCCWQGDECGGNSTCPVEMCCWIGTNNNSLEMRKPRPMGIIK